jgi:fructan beta-fructosidase
MYLSPRLSFLFVLILSAFTAFAQTPNLDEHRPQIHFSPRKGWMNDPNGMVYYKGTWHLFFQHYPEGIKWGPMHWGHATSKDLVSWEEKPIALFPDSLGYIFSGSVVVDEKNTSGFGKKGDAPLVAIFTHHDPKKEKLKTNDHQYQSLAYSTDNGNTWKKYEGNPVLKNPGIQDFRDPKVMWHEESNKWIMTLATKDCISFYSSADLKSWTKESEFGKTVGAHGGVWECPDLFPLEHNGRKVWVLIVNINPGGPNGGSGTQYFTGKFDGKTFTAASTNTKWADFGPDEYAGVTWSNTGNRKIFLGWMSNWQYAEKVPTVRWRSAMTLPRELGLKEVEGELYLTSLPVAELEKMQGRGIDKLQNKPVILKNIQVKGPYDLTTNLKNNKALIKLEFSTTEAKQFSVLLSDYKGDELVVGYDRIANQFYIDRRRSGKTNFDPAFDRIFQSPRISRDPSIKIMLIYDVASVELFADDGLNVMTATFFPNENMSKLSMNSRDGITMKEIKYTPFKELE